MTYTIYSIGDAAFLATILNSLAMVAATQDFKMAAGIGALLGVLFMMIRGLMQSDGRGMGYQNLITAILLYLALFVPTTRVAIEDAYTGEMRVIDQVPLGPAVGGAILSTLGYRLTVLFEQGFSTPSMSQHGFLTTLEIITAVRRNLKSRMDLGSANSPRPGSDFEETVMQYVKDCTLTGVDLGLTPIDQILRGPKLLEALRFDSDIYTTALYLKPRQDIVTCTEAWPTIEAFVTHEGLAALEKRLEATLGGNTPTTERLQTALDALTRGHLSASDYMISAALLPMFEAGVIRRHEDSLHAGRAAMVETAIQQRNTQWAAEETLFSRIVRPMMAWIEGFSFAITPIMAFTLLLGGRGIQMMGQYFLMLVWIQLWMPILAIINLYVTLAATHRLDALDRAAFALPSIMGLYQFDMTLQNWLAVGGMLASSTPAIALMLVYGGSITATHFLGRMQSGDFVDEKVGAPPVITPSGMVNMTPSFRHGPQSGVMGSDAQGVLPAFQISQDHSVGVQSAEADAQKTSTHFMQQLQHQARSSKGLRQEGFDRNGLAERLETSNSQTDRFMAATGESYADRYRDTGMRGEDYAALVGAAARGSAGGASGGVSVQSGLSAQLQNRFHVDSQKANDIASDISSRVSSDRDWQSHLAQSIASDVQQGVQEIASLGFGEEQVQSLGRSATEAMEAQRSYLKTLAASERHGTNVSIGAGEAGYRLAEQPEAMAALDKALGTLGLRGDATRLGAEWQTQRLINDDTQSYAAAGLSLLTGQSPAILHPLDEEQQELARTLGDIIMGKTFSTPFDTQRESANLNADLDGSRAPQGAIEQAFSHRDWNSDAAGDRLDHGEIERRIRDLQALSDHPEGAHHDLGQKGHEALQNAESSASEPLHQHQRAFFHDRLAAEARGGSSPAAWTYESMGEPILEAARALQDLGIPAAKSFIEAYQENIGKGSTWEEALREAGHKITEIRDNVVDRLVDQEGIKTQGALSPEQTDFLKETFREQLGRLLPTPDSTGNRLNESRQRLLEKSGDEGPHIAGILEKMAGRHRPDLVGLLRQFNRTAED